MEWDGRAKILMCMYTKDCAHTIKIHSFDGIPTDAQIKRAISMDKPEVYVKQHQFEGYTYLEYPNGICCCPQLSRLTTSSKEDMEAALRGLVTKEEERIEQRVAVAVPNIPVCCFCQHWSHEVDITDPDAYGTSHITCNAGYYGNSDPDMETHEYQQIFFEHYNCPKFTKLEKA
jgi:hypothetical protein